jgi:hypothetical protein
MKKYYIDGNEVSAFEKAKHKLKQLNEASELLEEFSDRCAWADDCAEYDSIKETIDPVYTAIEHAKDEIDEMIQEIENKLEEHSEKMEYNRIETEKEFEHNIQNNLE